MKERDTNLEVEKARSATDLSGHEMKAQHPLLRLQQAAGNQAVQRMVARSSSNATSGKSVQTAGAAKHESAGASDARSSRITEVTASPASSSPTISPGNRDTVAPANTSYRPAIGGNSNGSGQSQGSNPANQFSSSAVSFTSPEDLDAGGGRLFVGSRNGKPFQNYPIASDSHWEAGRARGMATRPPRYGSLTGSRNSFGVQSMHSGGVAAPLRQGVSRGEIAQHLSRSSGEPLENGVRDRMEQAFGYDFSSVRIHNGFSAAELSQQLGARAFAAGTEIAFRPGEYRPATAEGLGALAHELAHVVQQTGALTVASASYKDLEAQAETAAGHVISGRSLPKFSAAAVAGPQMLEKPDATGLESVPVATMGASFSGLFIQPPYNATLSIATSWLRQAAAVILKRLLGPRYEPGKLENDAIKNFGIKPQGRLADTAAEEQAKKDKKPAPFYGFLLLAPLAMDMIQWLRSGEAGEKYAVDILPSQEELLVLGMDLSDLWTRIQKQAQDQNKTVPKWYSEGIFRQDMNNFGTLLRQFHSAAADARDEKAGQVLTALLPAVLAMEAIRRDVSLADKPDYALLWNIKRPKSESKGGKGDKAPAPVQAEIAPEDQALGFTAISMLVFSRTQPALMEAAIADTDEGKSARLELLTRYGRFFQRMPVGIGGGDQKLLEKPGFFNTRPFPARLTAYPEPGAPVPQEPQGKEIDFIMSIDVKDFWEAWTTLSYHFRFELIKIPEERYLNTASAQEKTEVFSRWKLYKRRLARDSRYNAADVLRIMKNQRALFGDPGTAVELTTLNALLRYAGTTISTILQAVFDPNNLARFTLPEEGLYIVRCAAGVNTPENAEVKRPPSVAYLQIFSVDPEVLAESQLQMELSADEQSDARWKEINDLLKDPNAPNRAALLEEKDKIEKQKTVAGSIELAKKDLQGLLDKSTDIAEKEQLKKRIEQLDEIVDMRSKRGLDKMTVERIPAVFVGDNGKVMSLLLEAVDKSDASWPTEKRSYYVSDSTTADSGHDTETAEVSAEEVKKGKTAKGKAIMAAVKHILEGTMGYGRGNVSIVVGSETLGDRIEASETQILLEGLSNLATVASVAAIAAAPFTGGESLVLLIPIGVIGAIPSAYRLATRAEAGNLRNDLSTWMDVVNIASAFVGLGTESQVVKTLAKQAIVVRGGLMITAIGTHGLNVILLSEQVKSQLDEVGNLPPELRAAHIAEIIEGAAVNAGIMIGGMLAAKYRITEATKGVQEKSVAEWKDSLSEKTKEIIKEPSIFTRFMEMSARVREVFTHCSDYCIPKNVTKEQAARVEALLDRLKVTPDDERAIKIYFHDQVPYDAENPAEQQKKLEAAIKALEDLPTQKELQKFLDKSVPVSDRVLGLFEKLRNDPDLQKLVNKIVDPKQGGVSIRTLGDIMDQVKARRGGAARILDYIDKLTTRKPTNYERVLADLAKGYNFFTGAEWVLRFITENKLWEKVKAFEIEETDPDGTRRWDAKIGQTLFQFKSWIKFWASTFIKQVHQDFLKSGGFGKFLVQWVFDAKIGDYQSVKTAMIAALDAELARPEPRISKLEVDAIKARINDILVVGKP